MGNLEGVLSHRAHGGGSEAACGAGDVRNLAASVGIEHTGIPLDM
jgi:hypothetical protein